MTRRVGLLGGTFDPIHLGHLDLGEAAQNALHLTSVVALPAHVPPHRPAPVVSVFHRFAMTAIAVAGRDGWTASDMELSDPGYSFTVTTLQRMHAQGYRPDELFFVIGADAFADITVWKDYPAILDLAHFAVVSRPGFPAFALRERLPEIAARIVDADDFNDEARRDAIRPSGAGGTGTVIVLIDAVTADVSSTIIRQRLSTGEPVNEMLAPGVLQHIEQHGLYRSPIPSQQELDRGSPSAAGRLHGQS